MKRSCKEVCRSLHLSLYIYLYLYPFGVHGVPSSLTFTANTHYSTSASLVGSSAWCREEYESMRGLHLSRHAWRPRLLRAAVALYTNRAAPSVYSGRCLYSTTQNENDMNDSVQRHSSTTVGTSSGADTASDDAMDLIWSGMPDVHDAMLRSNSQEHGVTTSAHVPQSSPLEGSQAPGANGTAESSPAPSVSYVWVSMHNMPRNWLHEDIVEMIHQVAEHAGISSPDAPGSSHSAEGREGDATGEEDDEGHTGEGTSSALRHMPSPFVRRLHVPFGRRTGLVYGSPKLLLTSQKLADYLVHQLSFDPDDFRSRVYFTHTKPEELPGGYQRQQPHEGQGAEGDAVNGNKVAQVMYTPIEETVELEQEEALRTLVLDRYLFAPDLLLDIAKSHQKRLVTKNEKVLLDAFVDGDEDSDEEEEEEDKDDDAIGDADNAAASPTPRQRHRRRHGSTTKGGSGKRKKSPSTKFVRAGTQKHLGRGSMHNVPIPKPYVEGRNL
ncbi:hypothetical protein, conserved [Leishmania tarentolae]|uniref:Uncharacterized protein n=1 Tax=Leishmania tarentolae TaxID=5689 RepID=A0A640KBM2_LEITA|nr:hypothetical protein, conserved [Leishmania tarentolae]